jgi:sugar O-acyltransferase (sialic acid O-acetyltransferase NeuD family)
MPGRKSAKPRLPEEVVLCGLESSYAAEVLETLGRLGLGVAAGVLTGKSPWSMRGFHTILQSAEVSDLLARLPAVFALVNPKRRRAAVDWAMARGFKDFPRVIDPLAHLSPSAYVEKGVSIGGNSIIGAAAELDRFVMVNRQASIGHHSVLEELVTVGPGVSIASHCRIEQGVMIGTGAVIAPSIVIGAHATISAGAVVLRPVPPGVTVIGNPARIARTEALTPDASEPDADPH